MIFYLAASPYHEPGDGILSGCQPRPRTGSRSEATERNTARRFRTRSEIPKLGAGVEDFVALENSEHALTPGSYGHNIRVNNVSPSQYSFYSHDLYENSALL